MDVKKNVLKELDANIGLNFFKCASIKDLNANIGLTFIYYFYCSTSFYFKVPKI